MATLLNPPDQNAGPQIRVLYCLVCGTIDELPLYDGNPDEDHLLQILVEPHKFPSGEPHRGHLFRLPQNMWEREDARKKIIEQIKGGGSAGLDEFDKDFYATKNTFKEDAMACYNRHLRPTEGCEDYNSPSKRLLPNTKSERKDLGLPDPAKAPGPKNYLCQFCPIDSVIKSRTRLLKGGA